MPTDPGSVSTNIKKGEWRITYFWDSDHEETDHFNGYSFAFNDDGSLIATSSSTTVTGSWSTGSDDGKTELIITFLSPTDFAELNDDWDVIKQTDVKIELEDISGGNGGTDYLTFEKL
ncbi:MAG: hypothetical protein HKN22_08885 [Bacteroidia bacterium]|nr:hypothetical protein [Bacteroidia bacterium]